MFFGVNQNHADEMMRRVSPVTMLRSYKPDWPTDRPGMTYLLSVRPDPAGFCAGHLDDHYVALAKNAPPGAMLSTWHEPRQAGLTVKQANDMHRHMRALVRDANPKLLYGSVTTPGTYAYTIKGLDFYALDLYNTGSVAKPTVAVDALNKAFGKLPDGRRVIAETNNKVVSRRAGWFEHMYGWLAKNNGVAMLTFWLPDGPLSGRWRDDDQPTIDALNRIAASAAA